MTCGCGQHMQVGGAAWSAQNGERGSGSNSGTKSGIWLKAQDRCSLPLPQSRGYQDDNTSSFFRELLAMQY